MRALTHSITIFCLLGGYQGAVKAADDPGLLLPHAKPGECYSQVVIPAQYRTESSTVVVRQATERLEIIPAKYNFVEENVLVSEASVKYNVVPATFKTEKEEIEISPARSEWVSGSIHSSVAANPGVLSIAADGGVPVETAKAGQCFVEYYEGPQYEQKLEKVLISEASETIKIVPAKYEWQEQKELVAAATHKMVEIPAVYETTMEKIKVQDARVEWQKGRGAVEKINNSTGDIMCLVEIPAVYKTVEKTTMKSPPTSKLVAEPAKFESVRVRKLVDEARQVRAAIPARYREIGKQVKVSDGRHFWLGDALAKPENGRKTGNKICKKEIPAKTTTVTRTVVATPSLVTPEEIPARYETKKVRKLLSEAKEKRIAIPAVTKDVSTRIKVSSAKLEWRPVLCETNMTDTTIRNLQGALNDAGYDVGEINGVLSDETMSSIRRFQSENGMATGGLTIEVLEKLDVRPGQ